MNSQTNKDFLASVTVEAKSLILGAIAKHYQISEQEAFDEVTGEGAEHLLDYMVEPERSATRVLMQMHSFR